MSTKTKAEELADDIDPLVRRVAPDHLTCCAAAMVSSQSSELVALTDEQALPQLPTPVYCLSHGDGLVPPFPVFRAFQMRDFARAAISEFCRVNNITLKE